MVGKQVHWQLRFEPLSPLPLPGSGVLPMTPSESIKWVKVDYLTHFSTLSKISVILGGVYSRYSVVAYMKATVILTTLKEEHTTGLGRGKGQLCPL